MESIGIINFRRLVSREGGLGTEDTKYGNCMADCLLIPPKSLDNANNHIITANLWSAYGETDHEESAFPYVMQTWNGGGECAQACCFMATALLHSHTCGIYGLSEISEIAHGNIGNCRIRFGELHNFQMRDFFRDARVGLNAFVEDGSQIGVTGENQKRLILSALRSYVLSGVPVLLSVKPDPSYVRVVQNENHCVVINGVNRDSDQFFIADPAYNHCHPFRDITFEDIWAQNKNELTFVPVVPKGVKRPLTQPLIIDPITGKLIPATFHSLLCPQGMTPRKIKWHLECIEFLLVRLDKDEEIYSLDGADRRNLSIGNIQNRLEDFASRKELKGHWCWVEFRKEHNDGPITKICIYDAQTDESAGVFSPEEIDLSDSNPPERSARTVDRIPFSPTPNRGILQLGLLTSFNTLGLDKTFRDYHEVIHNAYKQHAPIMRVPYELYTFMHSTVAFLKGTAPGLASLPDAALEFLAKCNQIPNAAQDISKIINTIPRMPSANIVSLASFFPYLSLDNNMNTVQLTREALCFLVKLALALRDQNGGCHEIKTIELVTGSRVRNLDKWRLEKSDDYGLSTHDDAPIRTFSAETMDSATARANIIQNLVDVLNAIKAECGEIDPPLNFAIEIEPGQLFAINSYQSIRNFCKQLYESQKDEPELRHVGINLDIAHWNIAFNHDQSISDEFINESGNLDLSKLIQDRYIFPRICHAHISGYHKVAHFSDLSIKTNSGIGTSDHPVKNVYDSSFDQWIDLFRQRMDDQKKSEIKYQNYPKCSGYVICELEATSELENVTETLSTLLKYALYEKK